MEIRNFLFFLKTNLRQIFLVLFVLGFAGCAEMRTREAPPRVGGAKDGPSVRYPIQPQTQNTPIPPAPSKKPKVGLILGPGGAKSFALIGVLKELEKSRIPIDYVVGIEHGALVGALYAANGKANEVEWKMNKLDRKTGGKNGFFKSGAAPSVASIDGFIDENMNRKSNGDFSVNFGCMMTSTQSGFTRLAPSGSIKEMLHNCLPFPPLYQIDRGQVAGVFGIKEAADALRSKGAELVIFVNVLDQGVLTKTEGSTEQKMAAMLWFELRKAAELQQPFANEVINVTTRGFEIEDFSERKKLIAAGEQAGRRASERLSSQYGF